MEASITSADDTTPHSWKCKVSTSSNNKNEGAQWKKGLRLNIKKMKLMTTGRTTNLRNGNEDIKSGE